MKTPLAGQIVKLAHPFGQSQGYNLTPEHILIFMGEMEAGRWRVLTQGLPFPSLNTRTGFGNAQFAIPSEHFEEPAA